MRRSGAFQAELGLYKGVRENVHLRGPVWSPISGLWQLQQCLRLFEYELDTNVLFLVDSGVLYCFFASPDLAPCRGSSAGLTYLISHGPVPCNWITVSPLAIA